MRTVCIDIDGTISRYIEWVDAKTFGEVLPHCAETIHHLKADGWNVIIYTTRANKNEITKFLDKYNIPFDAINENPNQPENAIGGKPMADVYVDDRAIQFDGDWAGAYEKITGFKSWEEGPLKPTEPPLDYCGQLLINDFTQSMYTHRHYDTMNWQITKFAFSEILVAIGACWSVFNWDLAKETIPNLKWIVMLIICIASLFFGIISIITIVKNRVYFVRTSRPLVSG
jgi:adenylylsulfate kinase